MNYQFNPYDGWENDIATAVASYIVGDYLKALSRLRLAVEEIHEHDYRIVQVYGDDHIVIRCDVPGCQDRIIHVPQNPRGEKPKWTGEVNAV